METSAGLSLLSREAQLSARCEMTAKHSDSPRLKRALESEQALRATSFHKRKCSAFGIGLASTAFKLQVACARTVTGTNASMANVAAKRVAVVSGCMVLCDA